MNLRYILLGFRGRINRAKFWLATLILVIASMVLSGLEQLADFASMSPDDSIGTTGVILLSGILIVILSIVVVIAAIAVSIKRLHDRDMSGWWLLVFQLGPSVLGGLAAALVATNDESIVLPLALLLAAVAISIWAIVELGCRRGTEGPNQYGPDPLAGRGAAA